MFVGHLGVALGARRTAPKVPLGILVAATFGLDLIWPVFLLAGIERVRVDPGNTAMTPLAFDHYPWSHSLAMSILWGVAFGAVVGARLKAAYAGVVTGAVVVSHWVLDFITHRPDLPLWPGGPQVGLGLWHSVPGTLMVEGVLFAAGIELYRRAFPPRDATGRWSFWALVLFTGAIWLGGPFAPPPPDATSVAMVGLAMWLFPVWAMWIERHRSAVPR